MSALAELVIAGAGSMDECRRKLHGAARILGADADDAASFIGRASDLLRSLVSVGDPVTVRVALDRAGDRARLVIDCVGTMPRTPVVAETFVDRDGWHASLALRLPRGVGADEEQMGRAVAVLRAKTKEQLLEENNRLLRETIQARTEALNRLANELGGIQDLDTMLLRVLIEAREAFRCEGGNILLHESGRLRFRVASTGESNRIDDSPVYAGELSFLPIDRTNLAGTAVCDGLVVVRDAYDIPPSAGYRFNQRYDLITGFRTRAALAVAMRSSQGELLGVLQLLNPRSLDSDGPGEFSEDDVKLAVHFAGMASMALERSGMTRALVLRMMRLAELRDPKETGAHVRRVSEVASRLFVAWARRSGLDENGIVRQLDQLRPAAMLHDVGKVGIEDAILKKPGRLEPDERKVMELHARIGAATLLGVQTAMDPAIRDVTLYHHARWDGTGYPSHAEIVDTLRELGLDTAAVPEPRGTSIPLSARLVAIADVFDALMSRRAYKEAWDPADVRAEFEKSAGTHFDPELVALFLAEFDEYVHLHSMIQD